MHACMLSHFSIVWLSVTLWTADNQAPLSTELSRQEYWSGLPFLSPVYMLTKYYKRAHVDLKWKCTKFEERWEQSHKLVLSCRYALIYLTNSHLFSTTSFLVLAHTLFSPHSVQISCSVASDSLRPHELQHARPPCPSPTPRVHPNPCPLSQWRHPTISSSVIPFSSWSQSFPESGSSPMSQLFASGGQSVGVSTSTTVLPKNTQDWSPLGWTGWISLQFKGLSRVFSNTIVQKHQFFGAQPSL